MSRITGVVVALATAAAVLAGSSVSAEPAPSAVPERLERPLRSRRGSGLRGHRDHHRQPAGLLPLRRSGRRARDRSLSLRVLRRDGVWTAPPLELLNAHRL